MRELVSVDPATLETVGTVAITAPEELFCSAALVVDRDNEEEMVRCGGAHLVEAPR